MSLSPSPSRKESAAHSLWRIVRLKDRMIPGMVMLVLVGIAIPHLSVLFWVTGMLASPGPMLRNLDWMPWGCAIGSWMTNDFGPTFQSL